MASTMQGYYLKVYKTLKNYISPYDILFQEVIDPFFCKR